MCAFLGRAMKFFCPPPPVDPPLNCIKHLQDQRLCDLFEDMFTQADEEQD